MGQRIGRIVSTHNKYIIHGQEVVDAHVMTLAAKCPGLTTLADKCRELKHADFGCCRDLTDAAVAALADKCR